MIGSFIDSSCSFIGLQTKFLFCKRDVPSEKVSLNLHKMHRFRFIPHMCNVSSKHFSPLIHCIVSNEGPDQTAQMRILILAFVVRICSKARFRGPYNITMISKAPGEVMILNNLFCFYTKTYLVDIHWFASVGQFR